MAIKWKKGTLRKDFRPSTVRSAKFDLQKKWQTRKEPAIYKKT
jgi:hypothetical protein